MPQLPRISMRLAASQAARTIHDAILRGDLAPGSHLSELELSRQLGVSRAPIREALVQLSAEGVLDLVPNRGAFVRGLSSNDVKEIYTARYLLEGYLVALATENGNSSEVQGLLDAADHCQRCAEEGDLK